MSAILASHSIQVIDASLAIWAVLGEIAQVPVVGQFARWHRDQTRLVAPALWLAEGVSAIREVVHARSIPAERGSQALESLFALEIESISMDAPLCRSALEWAARLRQSRAYDGFYLALAERLGTEVWTADRRLANGAQQVGAVWVRWIGEAQARGHL
jgi:predicted nucleic acid-binding protein